jgi:hypothetical protein
MLRTGTSMLYHPVSSTLHSRCCRAPSEVLEMKSVSMVTRILLENLGKAVQILTEQQKR